MMCRICIVCASVTLFYMQAGILMHLMCSLSIWCKRTFD